MEKGNRVGAILGSENKKVEFLGYGTYEGEEIPVDAIGLFGRLCKDAGRPNPKIRLDNGEIVWGCECWWGGEKAVKKQLDEYKEAGYSIEDVSIREIRKELLKEEK